MKLLESKPTMSRKIFVQTHHAKQHYFVLWHIKSNQLPAHHSDELCTSFTRYSEQNQYLCYETHQSIDKINDQPCLYRKKRFYRSYSKRSLCRTNMAGMIPVFLNNVRKRQHGRAQPYQRQVSRQNAKILVFESSGL